MRCCVDLMRHSRSVAAAGWGGCMGGGCRGVPGRPVSDEVMVHHAGGGGGRVGGGGGPTELTGH